MSQSVFKMSLIWQKKYFFLCMNFLSLIFYFSLEWRFFTALMTESKALVIMLCTSKEKKILKNYFILIWILVKTTTFQISLSKIFYLQLFFQSIIFLMQKIIQNLLLKLKKKLKQKSFVFQLLNLDLINAYLLQQFSFQILSLRIKVQN